MKKICWLTGLFLLFLYKVTAQENNRQKDSLFIYKVEDSIEPDKILHAEPLYIDLIRDLGARKGEKEWNVGLGLTDLLDYDAYEALIEYEFAPVNRLGLEFELPFTFYSGQEGIARDSVPSNRLEAIQFAAQWSFLVKQEWKTSMALGYLNELEVKDLDQWGEETDFFIGNVFNPFYVVAKRWGGYFHTLIYAGPLFHLDFADNSWETSFEWNTNLHWMISGTDHFIGIELNKEWDHGDFDMVVRPQMRLDISDTLMIGLVTGIPVSREKERLSFFMRLIYEPEH